MIVPPRTVRKLCGDPTAARRLICCAGTSPRKQHFVPASGPAGGTTAIAGKTLRGMWRCSGRATVHRGPRVTSGPGITPRSGDDLADLNGWLDVRVVGNVHHHSLPWRRARHRRRPCRRRTAASRNSSVSRRRASCVCSCTPYARLTRPHPFRASGSS